MNKQEKFEYRRLVEDYLENNTNPSSDSDYFTHVYELFLYLYKQLLIHRPENPLDFLMNKIGKKESTKIFVVGPPGCQSKEVANQLSEYFLFDKISVGEILRNEAEKDGDSAKHVKDHIKDYRMVNDQIAIDAVKAKIPHG